MFGKLISRVTLWTILISLCSAELEAPTNLKAEWTDHTNIKVSWTKPKSLPRDCDILYEYILNDEKPERILQTHFLKELLTESAAKWNVSVRTVGTSSSCLKSTSSKVTTGFEPPNPKAEVTDFNCYLSTNDLNCSWILDPSSPVSVKYRVCGTKINFSECNFIYDSESRRYCHLKGNFLQKELCIVAATPNGHISTFKAPKAFILPNMRISEEDTNLVLNFAPLAVNVECSFFNICYSFCDHDTKCQNHNQKTEPFNIPYVKSCQYKFQYRALTDSYCKPISSRWSEEIIYGYTDWTPTVLTIVIPVIVSAFVILSCICFRRHKDIICPDVPDPSAIVKEMINSNKDYKPSLYTPVLEPIEPLSIVPHIPQTPRLEAT